MAAPNRTPVTVFGPEPRSGATGTPGVIALYDSAGTKRYLWFTTNGTLMTGSATGILTPNGGADADHVVVGGQSTV